jgi:hypothetical protein
MRMQDSIKVGVVFIVLTVVGVGMAAIAWTSAEAEMQQLLIPIGSAIFGGALAFFLIKMFDLDRRAKQ